MTSTKSEPRHIQVPTTCQFCSVPVLLKLCPAGMSFFKEPDAIISLAACNRCAEYRLRRAHLIDYAVKQAMGVYCDPNSEAFSHRLDNGIRAFCRLVNDHYRVELALDESLLGELRAKPRSVRQALLLYANEVCRQATGYTEPLSRHETHSS